MATHCNKEPHFCRALLHTEIGLFCIRDLAISGGYLSLPPHSKTSGYDCKTCNTLQHTATHCNTLQHTAIITSAYGCHTWSDAFDRFWFLAQLSEFPSLGWCCGKCRHGVCAYMCVFAAENVAIVCVFMYVCVLQNMLPWYVCLYVCACCRNCCHDVCVFVCVLWKMLLLCFMCVYVCVYLCVYVSVCTCVCVYIWVCVYVCVQVCMYSCVLMCMHICMYACKYARAGL